MLEHTGRRAGKIVRARRVFGIGRGGDQRQPVRVARSVRIKVIVSVLNGRNGPPEMIEPLAVPGGYSTIGHRHGDQGEEPGTVANIVEICISDAPKGTVPVQDGV